MLTVRLCAAGLSLVAFATALVIGLWSDIDYITIVTRALYVMLVFYVLGNIVGRIGQIAIEDCFEREKAAIEAEVRAEFEKKNEGSVSEVDGEIGSGFELLDDNESEAEEPGLVASQV